MGGSSRVWGSIYTLKTKKRILRLSPRFTGSQWREAGMGIMCLLRGEQRRLTLTGDVCGRTEWLPNATIMQQIRDEGVDQCGKVLLGKADFTFPNCPRLENTGFILCVKDRNMMRKVWGGLKLSPVEPHRTVRQSRNQTHIARWDPSWSRTSIKRHRSHSNDGGTFVSNCVCVHINLGSFKALGCSFFIWWLASCV